MRFPDEVLVGENADGKLYVATVSVGLRPERYIHESKALRYAADKLDEVSQLNDQIAALKAERELWKDRAVAVASHLDYEVLCGDIQQWVKQFRAGNQRQAEKIKRLLEGLKGLANHVVGEGGDSDNMRQEAQDIINQEEEKA